MVGFIPCMPSPLGRLIEAFVGPWLLNYVLLQPRS